MANFNLVVDSTFQPFSYERYLQPIQAYAEEYKQQEQAANALARDLADVQASLSTETDADTLEYLKNYENQLRSKVDQLAEVGLTPTSRKEIYDLNTAYGQQVMPVVNAYNTRTKMIEDWYTNQDKYAYKDDPRTMSLMNIMGNPTANEKGSLDVLSKAGSDWAKKLSTELQSVTDKWCYLDNNQKSVIFEQLQQDYGLSSKQVNDFINGRMNNESLNTLINTVLKSQGITEDWMDYNKARSTVESSLAQAIGTDTYLSKFIPLGSSGSGSGSGSIPVTGNYHLVIDKSTSDFSNIPPEVEFHAVDPAFRVKDKDGNLVETSESLKMAFKAEENLRKTEDFKNTSSVDTMAKALAINPDWVYDFNQDMIKYYNDHKKEIDAASLKYQEKNKAKFGKEFLSLFTEDELKNTSLEEMQNAYAVYRKDKENEAVVKEAIHQLVMTDKSALDDALNSALTTLTAEFPNSELTLYKNGKIKQITPDDVKEKIEKDGIDTYNYTVDKGLYFVTKKGERISIPVESFLGSTNYKIYSQINDQIQRNPFALDTAGKIDSIIKMLYNFGTTKAYAQSKTDSKALENI